MTPTLAVVRCAPRSSITARQISGAPNEDAGDSFLRRSIVATDEHRRHAVLVVRIDHLRRADRVERFDEANVAELALQSLHQRLVQIREKAQEAAHRRCVGDGIRCIDHRFAG